MIKEMRLETERLIIRPYVEEDLMECFNLMQDKDLFKYIDMEVMTFEEYKGLFNWLIRSYEIGFNENFKYSFNIILKETGEHIGWCGIGGSDFNNELKEIYYLIAKEYWGKGYATEASVALLDYSFKTIKLDKIYAMAKTENIASNKVIQKLGLKFQYIFEGLPKEFEFFNGEPCYCLTREEYESIKKGII